MKHLWAVFIIVLVILLCACGAPCVVPEPVDGGPVEKIAYVGEGCDCARQQDEMRRDGETGAVLVCAAVWCSSHPLFDGGHPSVALCQPLRCSWQREDGK